MKRFLMAALMVGGFSLTMHGQIVLLEEDESTVEQVIPQQTIAPSAPVQTQPAQSGFTLVDEEEEAARVEAERKAAEKAAAAEAARVEAERKAAEKAAAAEAARVEAERKAAEEAAAAEAARVEAERKAAEEAAAAEAARVEAERKAAEEAAAAEAARVEAEKQEAERLAAEEAARAEAERQEAERLAAEEAARLDAERQEAERLAAEEAARIEEERKAAEAAVVVAAPVPVPVLDSQSTPAQNTAAQNDAAQSTAAQNTAMQDAPADESRDKAIDAALEAQKAALKAAEDARAAAAKADSLLKLQREQEIQLRMLEAQRQAEIEARAKAEAELMERARQEAEMRAKAKAEAEYRARMEAERRAEYYGEAANAGEQKENVFTRFYRRNGVNQFSIISAGYTTYFYLPNSGHKAAEYAGKRHLLALEIFEWRAKCFGMQMFNFEIGLNSITKGQLFEHGNAEKNGFETTSVAKEMWFAYKPAMKFYIPCTTWMAVELYGGLEVDMTAVWSKVNKKYYEACPDVPEQNFFFAPFGGLGVVFYPVHAIPIEVKAEYRHPMQLKGRGNMNIIPQGVYLTAQIQLATRTKKR